VDQCLAPRPTSSERLERAAPLLGAMMWEMIRHVVMFRWAGDVDSAHVDRVAAALNELSEAIPEIDRYAHGSDLGLVDGNYEYAVVGDFDSVETYETYRDHPLHRSFIADLIAGRISDRAAVQYEC
jgi:hypothetical protein